MRIVFCGSGEFAVPSLRALLDTRHEVVRIVTQPARPAGRGKHLRPTPVAAAAGELGLEACEWADINAPETVEQLREDAAAAMVVIDFGQFVRTEARQTARVDCINLHGSLLPALRGAAPVNWAIIRGHAITGVTTFSLVDRMDAGPIYLTAETPIEPHETAVELKTRLAERGAGVVRQTLGLLASAWAEPSPQDEDAATRAPRLTKRDGRIEWEADAEAIRNLIHGTWPWPGAQAVFLRDGKPQPVIIARAEALDAAGPADPGAVDEDLCIASGAGRLCILQIKPAGKRLMDWKDFVNGYRVSAGDRFAEVGS